MSTVKQIYLKPYRERKDLRERLHACETLTSCLRDADLPLNIKKRMLNHAVWAVTIARGNFASRFRSAGVLNGTINTTRIQREHVYKREQIVKDILAKNEPLAATLDRIVHCLVTVEEHGTRLNKVDPGIDGPQRYIFAGVQVYDCSQEPPEIVWS